MFQKSSSVFVITSTKNVPSAVLWCCLTLLNRVGGRLTQQHRLCLRIGSRLAAVVISARLSRCTNVWQDHRRSWSSRLSAAENPTGLCRLQCTNKIKFLLITILSHFVGCTGGLRRLRLWEPTPRPYSFCSRLDERRSPAVKFDVRKDIFEKAATPFCTLMFHGMVSVSVYFKILSQCII